jgi:hypothetical protein
MTIDSIKQSSAQNRNGVQPKQKDAPLIQLLRAIKLRSQNFTPHPLVINYAPCKPSDPSSVCYYYVSEVVSRGFLFLKFRRERMLFSASPACHDDMHDGEEVLDVSCRVFNQHLADLVKEELLRYVGLHGAKVHLGHLVIVPDQASSRVRTKRPIPMPEGSLVPS